MRMTLIFLGFSLLAPTSINAQSLKPNVILVYIDDMGFGDIGVSGANAYQTHNFNQLQKEGIFFTQFYPPQADCTASIGGLLTGTYTNRIGFSGALDHRAKKGLSPGKNRRPVFVIQ